MEKKKKEKKKKEKKKLHRIQAGSPNKSTPADLAAAIEKAAADKKGGKA